MIGLESRFSGREREQEFLFLRTCHRTCNEFCKLRFLGWKKKSTNDRLRRLP